MAAARRRGSRHAAGREAIHATGWRGKQAAARAAHGQGLTGCAAEQEQGGVHGLGLRSWHHAQTVV